MRPLIVEAIDRFTRRGENSRSVDPQTLWHRDQAELDRVPVKPGQLPQMPEPQRLQPSRAIGLHVIGKDRVHQQRYMAVDVMKDIRLLQVVELVAVADEAGR